jgi:hypothetical protein
VICPRCAVTFTRGPSWQKFCWGCWVGSREAEAYGAAFHAGYEAGYARGFAAAERRPHLRVIGGTAA